MIKEIYIRTPEDPYYSEGIIDFTNEAEEIITQIKVLKHMIKIVDTETTPLCTSLT